MMDYSVGVVLYSYTALITRVVRTNKPKANCDVLASCLA